MGKIVCLLFISLLAVVLAKPYDNILEKINSINKAQNYWEAGYTKTARINKSEYKRLLGGKIMVDLKQQTRKSIKVANNIPATFDARDQWPDCDSISSIKDQGQCGDCWAVSTASAASDRLCIATNGETQLDLSAENLMTCCAHCSDGQGGCNGGDPQLAWKYLRITGIVTGGDYGSGEGCQPYSSSPSGANEQMATPSCKKECTNDKYDIPYNEDLHFGGASHLLKQDVSQIQTEILNNGPVVALFTVYDDFQYYKKGVYVKNSDKNDGNHVVRVIGWGTDKQTGLDYWLAANSWNTTFGEDGLFRIRRGTNECGFENYVTSGVISS